MDNSRIPPEALRYRSSNAGSLARGSSNVVKLSLICRGFNNSSFSASESVVVTSSEGDEARLGDVEDSQGEGKLLIARGETVWFDVSILSSSDK